MGGKMGYCTPKSKPSAGSFKLDIQSVVVDHVIRRKQRQAVYGGA